MPDPTIPELVARLRELWARASIRSGGFLTREAEHAEEQLRDELRNALPILLDALERLTELGASMGFCAALTSDPWRPIAECGELEKGVVYLGWFSGAPRLVTYHLGKWYRYTDGRDAHGLTHVHRMGPIRGPGEG